MYFHIFIILTFCASNLLHGFIQNVFKNYKPSSSSSYHTLHVTSIMPPADLTPAVDKFPSLPTILNPTPLSELATSLISITARGPVPEGPEPFGLVANEVQTLAEYVKELVKSDNPVLTMASSHFFEQVL